MSLLAPRRAVPTYQPPPTGEVAPIDTVVTHEARRRITRPVRRREIVAVIEPVWPEPTADGLVAHRARPGIAEAAAERLTRHLRRGELVAAEDGRLVLRLRRADRAARPVRLQEMAYHALEVLEDLQEEPGSSLIDLGIGWAPITRRQHPFQAQAAARAGARESLAQRDLQPRHLGAHERRRGARATRWAASKQLLAAAVGSLVVPFLALVLLDRVGLDLSGALYWCLVGALSLTALGIWAECVAALDPPRPPPAPDGPAPTATAVIAAYLPNEADTVVETLHSFLSQRYAGRLQIVLAYNTPVPLPVEAELERLAAEHERLTVLPVADSTSKAQNVNAALAVAEGEFVGIFDADHHPMQGAFDRAWQWIADGADVVQGHCVIRNGEESVLAKLVAVEFEQIYAVAHPGRAAVHGFGIFGGSNGYWRAAALERTRLRGSFLTEDIEASMRLLARGGRIVSDPGLISRELAPTTPSALWRQRMRWAQGWFQVSLRHLPPILASHRLGLRQKLGAAYLLGWRELYPWLAVLSWPLLAFLAWRDGGLDMTSPVFLLLTLLITVSGPAQTLAGWRLAAPEIRRHRSWFVWSCLANVLAYTELKNLVNRIAHLKQLRGEHQWVVTPRTAPSHGTSDLEEAA